MKKNTELSIADMIKEELRWRTRLWRWMFPPEPLTIKELRKAVKKLKSAIKQEE